MSKLKAKSPSETVPRKPQVVIYGAPGVGKTWWALAFPNVYYIDCEGGAQRAHYMERLAKAGGSYLGPEDGSNDFSVIIEQTKALASEKHDFKTLVIDSITKPWGTAIANEADRLGDKDAFGASKKPAIGAMRRLIAAVHRLDMNVIFVAHETSDWGLVEGQRSEIGKKPDCFEKLMYELDLGLHLQKRGKSRVAQIKKSRLIGFPEGETFDLTYEGFAERYGKEIIEKPTTPILLATKGQVDEISRLVAILKIEEGVVEKWLEKANAESYSDFNTEQAAKLIEFLHKKLTPQTTTP